MKKLLYIQVSPRKERSHSSKIANAFIAAYQEQYPQDTVTIYNLFTESLPSFEGEAIHARYLVSRGLPLSQVQQQAWDAVLAIVHHFMEYDKYVFSVPMWNFSLPYRLKHYIDLLTQPRHTFSVSEKGYTGLVGDKPTFVVYSSGGSYAPDSPTAAMDKQRPQFEQFLRLIGLSSFQSLTIDGTGTTDAAALHEKEALLMQKAHSIARNF